MPPVKKAPPTLDDVIGQLRAPFTPAAVKWKIQSSPKQRNGQWSKALVVPFMDARLVAERLNHVAAGHWSMTFDQPVGPSVVCHLTVLGASRADVGYANLSGDDPSMAWKALYSDAFKRAAVQFGIGAFLYAVPKQFVDRSHLKEYGASYVLPPATERMLSESYGRWLTKPEVLKQFGEPIDHGDVIETAVIDEPESSPERINLEDKARAAFVDAGIDLERFSGMLDRLKAPPGKNLALRVAHLDNEALDMLIHQLGEAKAGREQGQITDREPERVSAIEGE